MEKHDTTLNSGNSGFFGYIEYSVFYLLDSRFVQSNDTARILNPVHALLWLSPGFDFAVDVNDLIFFEITQSKH